MALFQAIRRAKRWPVVIPIYDARSCIDCGALVSGDKGQDLHRAWHETHLDWQEAVNADIRTVAVGAGLNVRDEPGGGEIAGLDLQDDEQYDQSRRVSWRTLMAERAENDDERLTAKARLAMQGSEYDDEDDE
jgi:hypothetical protein